MSAGRGALAEPGMRPLPGHHVGGGHLVVTAPGHSEIIPRLHGSVPSVAELPAASTPLTLVRTCTRVYVEGEPCDHHLGTSVTRTLPRLRVPAMDDVALDVAVQQVLVAWSAECASGVLSEQSCDKFGLLLGRFSRFAAAHGICTLHGIDLTLADAFVHARGRTRHGKVTEPALATQHLRRAVLRMFTRTARALELQETDPARDITLPPRSRKPARPLSEAEAESLRYFAEPSVGRTRHAAVLVLALAGAHSGEIGHTTGTDIQLEKSRFWAHGSSKANPRWCPLDNWSAGVLRARVTQLISRGEDSAAPVATSPHGSDAQRQARACVALRDVLGWAGLAGEPDLKPASITAYAGLTEFSRTGRIEDAALRLGLRSLDRAAAAVGHDWLRRDLTDAS